MQQIAAWLVARPLHGVLGLAFTLFLPGLSSILGGVVMTHLVCTNGMKLTAAQAAVATSLLAVVALVVGASMTEAVAHALIWWLPVFFLAGLVRQRRSITLALQISVIIAVAGVLAFYVVLGDPSEFWSAEIAASIDFAREAGLNKQADVLSEGQSAIVPQMTMLFVFFCWSFFILILLLGYAFYQRLSGNEAKYGRFCDLNFGRVLAVVMAMSSLGALITGADWLQSASFVALAVFWVQGLAILHWLHVDGRLPWFALVMTYALLPILNVLLVISLAVLGYTDAWFNFRARARGES